MANHCDRCMNGGLKQSDYLITIWEKDLTIPEGKKPEWDSKKYELCGSCFRKLEVFMKNG